VHGVCVSECKSTRLVWYGVTFAYSSQSLSPPEALVALECVLFLAPHKPCRSFETVLVLVSLSKPDPPKRCKVVMIAIRTLAELLLLPSFALLVTCGVGDGER
jgi:hypothetical protein